MNKYRIITNGKKYRTQVRFLIFFWDDLWVDARTGVEREYETIDQAEDAIRRYKQEKVDERWYPLVGTGEKP